MRWLSLITGSLLAGGSALAAPCPTDVAWPAQDWPDRTVAVSYLSRDAITDLEAYVFPATTDDDDAERVGVRTDGVLLIKGGALIYEAYGRGFTTDTRHLCWSVTKSVLDALTGAAAQRGHLSLLDPICKYLVGVEGDVCEVLVADLLEQGSGLDWNEGYEDDPYAVSSVLAMLYGEGRRDMARFVVDHPLVASPGASFLYTTGGTVLLAKVLAGSAGARLASVFPWVFLFEPLGMASATMERDATGTFVGGSSLYATPRDLARFGFLYLHDGCWAGERIVPDGWVETSTRVSEPFLHEHPFWEGPVVPGRLWWLNLEVEGVNTALPWPDVPADAFAALGHWGQLIVVIPSLDLVVVRTGDDRDGSFEINEFLRRVIAVAKGT